MRTIVLVVLSVLMMSLGVFALVNPTVGEKVTPTIPDLFARPSQMCHDGSDGDSFCEKCTDVDGNNPFQMSYVLQQNLSSEGELWNEAKLMDKCISNSQLREWTCDGYRQKAIVVNCTNGCSLGACNLPIVSKVQPSIPSEVTVMEACVSDSDSGDLKAQSTKPGYVLRDKFLSSKVNANDKTRHFTFDKCQDESVLLERTCVSGKLVTEKVSCDGKCAGGAAMAANSRNAPLWSQAGVGHCVAAKKADVSKTAQKKRFKMAMKKNAKDGLQLSVNGLASDLPSGAFVQYRDDVSKKVLGRVAVSSLKKDGEVAVSDPSKLNVRFAKGKKYTALLVDIKGAALSDEYSFVSEFDTTMVKGRTAVSGAPLLGVNGHIIWQR